MVPPIPRFAYNTSTIQSPSGLLALPVLTAGRLDILAAAPTPLVLSPRGFDFVVALLPAAPVISLSELPYSRTTSPHERDVFAMLLFVR